MSDDISPETKAFLADLSKDDIATLRDGLPIVRMIVSFGKVTKWLAITFLGMAVGTVMLWESIAKILVWFQGR